jgi:hypothetical protein
MGDIMSPELLDAEIEAHIAKYCALPQEFLPVLSCYVRSTWLGDTSRTAPYLRLVGPAGSGKSRTLRVVGHLCYHPYMTSSASTRAATQRALGSLGRCTLLMDEFEHDARDDNMRFLNRVLRVGFEDDGTVDLTEERTINGTKRHVPIRLPVFGHKLFAAIHHPEDSALASRCLEVPLRDSSGRPVELPESYEAEVQALQDKLLAYRMVQRPIVQAEVAFPLGISGRLLQLYVPLAKVATPAQRGALNALIQRMQALWDKAHRPSGNNAILGRALEMIADKPDRTMLDFEAACTELGNPVSPQSLGLFRGRLGIETDRPSSNRGSRKIVGTTETIRAALARNGHDAAPTARAA